MRGVLKGQCIEHEIITQEFILPNKITTGARRLITEFLSNKIKNYTNDSFGIDRFILFDVISEGTCMDQLLLGSFDCYDTFDPLYLSDITTSNFPCLGNDSLVVTEIVDDITEDPLDGESLIIANVIENRIILTIKIGKGYSSVTPRKFALAGLFGRSPDSTNENIFCYAIEQFPVMVKTEVSSFKFEWTCFI